MTTSTPKHLRHFARVPFIAGAQLTVAGQPHTVHLLDIALRGALVEADDANALAVGQACSLMLPLADDGDGLAMQGRIVHCNGSHIGIECQATDLTSLTRLRRLMELNTGDDTLWNRELPQLFG